MPNTEKKAQRAIDMRRSALESVASEHAAILLAQNADAAPLWKAKVRAFAADLQVKILETPDGALDAFDVPGAPWPKL